MSNDNERRQLLIMRHGKANWEMEIDDLKRPMTERGVEEAINIGYWLSKKPLHPDIIISSNASRALATSKWVAEAMAISEIQQDARIYNASLAQLLAVLADIPSEYKRPMIVGHNPGFEELLLHLADVGEQFYKDGSLFTTGTVAILNMPDDWQPLYRHSAELLDVIRGGSC
ncbi:MAG: histidine phosphatase family protein [Gammaproteobacteria bacterium]|nr:histidine phosphatase family protein [Gammaproteobacteria bacterium]